ncbi:hypothetical protein CW713_10195 [Methanophagales archaeon]|nr:MAG: hypothetical protein CW713_10195 [Methanophagales archaeon]
MKKWEIGVLIGFFAVFIILFFSVESPWQPKTSKVGEIVWIDEVGISVDSVSVDERLLIDFWDDNRTIVKEYEAGAGWKFVILDVFVSNHANENRSFYTGWIEDENGAIYQEYKLRDYTPGTPYLFHQYKSYILNLLPDEAEFISIAYKMPTNAVPEKFHYSIDNSKTWYGEVILKK